jgi:hypothetical protein
MDDAIAKAWFEQELAKSTTYTDDDARVWYHNKYKICVTLPDTTHTCSNKCQFVKLGLSATVMFDPAFICRQSLLVHRCGIDCNRKFQDNSSRHGAPTRESICELTSIVVDGFICAKKPIETDKRGNVVLASRYDLNVRHTNTKRVRQTTVRESVRSVLAQLFCKSHWYMIKHSIIPIANIRQSVLLCRLREAIVKYYNVVYTDTHIGKNEICIFCIVCLIHCKIGMTIGSVDMFPKLDWIDPYFPNNPSDILKLVVISKSYNRMNTKVKKITSMSSHITTLMIYEEGVPNTDYIFSMPS